MLHWFQEFVLSIAIPFCVAVKKKKCWNNIYSLCFAQFLGGGVGWDLGEILSKGTDLIQRNKVADSIQISTTFVNEQDAV